MRPSLLAFILVLSACTANTAESGDGDALGGLPDRIVSLSATHTEMLHAIGAGDQVVATDLTSNYPAAAGDTPKVDAFNFNIEEIAAHHPDLVVTSWDFQGEVEAMQKLGIPVLLLLPATTLEQALQQIETLGAATGHEKAATDLVASMRTRIDSLIGSVGDSSLTFFHEVDNTLFTANSSTFLGDIYRRVGLVNIADSVPDEFGSGYVQLSEEYLLATDPDLIFLGDAGFGESAATVSARPGWETLQAVANGKIFELDGDIAGRWGPRTVDLVAQIVQAVEEAG